MARQASGYSPRRAFVHDGTSRQAVVTEDSLPIYYYVSLGGIGLLIRPRMLPQESIQGFLSAIEAIDFVLLTKFIDG
jgi:hypothetical protein